MVVGEEVVVVVVIIVVANEVVEGNGVVNIEIKVSIFA